MPTILICTLDILLIFELKSKSKSKTTTQNNHSANNNNNNKNGKMKIKRRTKNNNSHHRIAKTQMIFSFLFVLVSVPRSVTLVAYAELFPEELNVPVAITKLNESVELKFFLIKLFDLISSIQFNSIFFILLVHNKPFRQKFHQIFGHKLLVDDSSRRY